MCELSMKVPIRKKCGNLFNDPRIILNVKLKNIKKEKKNHEIKEHFSFELIGEILNRQIRTHFKFLAYPSISPFWLTHWCS